MDSKNKTETTKPNRKPRKNAVPLDQRIEKYIQKDRVSGCWLWTGCFCAQGKYPVIATQHNRFVYVDRYLYEKHKNPIPTAKVAKQTDGSRCFQVHHTCWNGEKEHGRCVNPDHMELLTERQHRSRHKEMRAKAKAQKTISEAAKRLVGAAVAVAEPDTCMV
jgi:hypothetical protein